MTKFKTFAALGALALSVLGAGQASANTIYFMTDIPHAVWVTVYLDYNNSNKQDWFCVTPGMWGSSSKSAYTNHPQVFVRAEVKKESQNCDDHSNIYDDQNITVNTGPQGSKTGPSVVTFLSLTANGLAVAVAHD